MKRFEKGEKVFIARQIGETEKYGSYETKIAAVDYRVWVNIVTSSGPMKVTQGYSTDGIFKTKEEADNFVATLNERSN